MPPADLKRFAQLISNLLSSVSESEIVVDRAHRLPQSSHLMKRLSSDVKARSYFFCVKEQLM